MTIGEDEQVSPQQSAMCLKVFDLDRMQPEGSSSITPDCIGILRIFTNQFPEAKVVKPLTPLFLLYIFLSPHCLAFNIVNLNDHKE